MHDFTVKDLMVTVLPEAADECLEGGSTAQEGCVENSCKPECNTGATEEPKPQATERNFRMLNRELQRILDQS